jgi:SAM-dependent methyltransferase
MSRSAETDVVHYDFCTLFDKNYLFKGLALHESLRRHVEDFTLWILCMDDTAFDVLERLDLPDVKLLSLAQFEDEDLLAAKETRTQVEYCWTCTPSLPLYLLEHEPGLESISYLDADLFFSDDPAPVFQELGEGSIGIVGHRYGPKWEALAEDSGIYNVGFMVFRNDKRALTCLSWWRDRCIEWCYHRVEDGKMGDQKYLDDWPARFEGVVVLQYKGAGLAPWNFDRYTISKKSGVILVDDEPLIVSHLHSLEIVDDGKNFILAYPEYGVSRTNAKLLYGDYTKALRRAIDTTRVLEPGYSYGIGEVSPHAQRERLRIQRRARLRRLLSSIPPLRWGWHYAKRVLRPTVEPVIPEGSLKDSWKAPEVAKQQKALIEEELRDPTGVAPFRTFLDIVDYVLQNEDIRASRFLDIGCGVGHFSELLHRFHPGRFDYMGCDYSPAMIETAEALWPHSKFVVHDVFDQGFDYSSYDIVMASALVDVIEDFWTVLDILFAKTSNLLILHRQRLTDEASYSVTASGYVGQNTYATYLNLGELEMRLDRFGLRIRKDFPVSDDIHSFLIERARPLETATVGEA